MRRTSVSIPDDVYFAAKDLATRESKHLHELVTEGLRLVLAQADTKKEAGS